MNATYTMGQVENQKVVHLHPQQTKQRITDQIGLIVFLGSWSMMFAALFFALGMVRNNLGTWPPPGFEPLPLLWPSINTAVLLLSSVTLHYGVRSFRHGYIARYRNLLAATLVLGFAFLGLQFMVWIELWNSGLQLTSGQYAAFFYLLTFFHAAHVVVGVGLMVWLVPQVMHAFGHPKREGRVRLASIFWHFVDVVWVLLFLTVYVL